MSVVRRCGAVGLMLGVLVGAGPAIAQTPSAEPSGSSWTDPPVRGSAGPDAPAAAKPAEITPEPKPPAAAEAPPAAARKPERSAAAPAPTPAEKAAATLGVKPVAAGGRSAGFVAQPSRPAVRPRMVERPLVIARRPGRLVERSARRASERERPAIRSYAYGPEPRYDGGYAGPWSRRRLAGWSGLIEESPASRIARARESGYLVMRMRTYAYPDGTFGRRLLPYDGGEPD